jgi:S1-C subfamily serine protease
MAGVTAAAMAAVLAGGVSAQTSRGDSLAQSSTLGAPAALADAHTSHQLPEGYLGITFVCDLRRQDGPEGLTIYHYGYPAVEVVQPGSPADRAGIVPGDTIVAYDSRDVLYRKIVLSRLLRPGSELAVRIRRNGAVKNLSVSIAPRPANFVDMNVAGYGGSPLAQPGGSASLDPRQWNVVPAPAAPFPSAGPTASQRSGGVPDDVQAPFDDDDASDDDPSVPTTVAGAEVVRTDADLQDALGLDGGLLVLGVGQSSAAARAGLRSGDVIVSAHGETIRTPQTLANILRRAKHDDEPVSLRVVRHHQARVVVLKSN